MAAAGKWKPWVRGPLHIFGLCASCTIHGQRSFEYCHSCPCDFPFGLLNYVLYMGLPEEHPEVSADTQCSCTGCKSSHLFGTCYTIALGVAWIANVFLSAIQGADCHLESPSWLGVLYLRNCLLAISPTGWAYSWFYQPRNVDFVPRRYALAAIIPALWNTLPPEFSVAPAMLAFQKCWRLAYVPEPGVPSLWRAPFPVILPLMDYNISWLLFVFIFVLCINCFKYVYDCLLPSHWPEMGSCTKWIIG